MKEFNEISDQEINQLLRQRLLEQVDMELLEAEANRVFASEPFVSFSKTREEELLNKLKSYNNFQKYFKWFFIGAIIVGVLTLPFVLTEEQEPHRNVNQKPTIANSNINSTSTEALTVSKTKLVKTRRLGPTSTSKNYSLEFHGGQFVPEILKQNADCVTPILVKDTVVFSPNTPIGTGNELEILNNAPDDELYFENEHNTVWYKFWAKEDGFLTFDIIPVDPNDDYDFMLYRYNGDDFRSKVLSKKLKPIRTCISRNDTSIQGKTGLSLHEPTEFFIHSGPSQSYVKYLQVKKGETFYLLIDNVYINGNGHMIKFHYAPYDPNKMYIGKSMVISNVMFISDEPEFKPGAKKGLDSLYRFLENNPNLKVEIQGHVNSGLRAHVIKYPPQELSELRAKAIYNYLINKGISAERLAWAGYGDWKKKIEIPKTLKEYRMNILADMLILSLDYKADQEWIKLHPAQPNAPH